MGLTDAGITEAQYYTPAVDQPPTIDTTPSPSSFTDGKVGSYDFSQHVTDNGVSAIVYSIDPILPNGLVLNNATGELTLDGAYRGQGNDTTFTLTVSNDTYQAVSSEFNIVIRTVTIDSIPSFSLGVNGTRDFITLYVTDPYSLVTTSDISGLNPTYATYTHAGGLVGVQANAGMSGLTLDVTFDGVTISSNQFTLEVTAVAEASWLGDNMSGEFGAIATNDNVEPFVPAGTGTTYEYQRQYAPTIGTIPVPSTPLASDEVIVTNLQEWTAAINNATYQKVFIQKGTDFEAGKNGYTTITEGGSAGNPRWIVYYDNVTPSNVQDIKPWNLAENEKVYPYGCRVEADHLRFVGLSWGLYENNAKQGPLYCMNVRGRDDIIFYRCHSQNAENSNNQFKADPSDCTNCYYLECLSHSSWRNPTGDVHAFALAGATDCGVISCEGYDMAGDIIQGTEGGVTDCVIEDNDCYRTTASYYDLDGTPNVNGLYAGGEVAITGKEVNGLKIFGNRCWGFKPCTTAVQPTGTAGYAIGRGGPGEPFNYCDVRYNVIEDCTTDYSMSFSGDSGGGARDADGNHSVVYNIVSNHDPLNGVSTYYAALWLAQDEFECYMNTVVDADYAISTFHQPTSGDMDNFEAMGNLFVNTTPLGANDMDTANCHFGYNGYVNASPEYDLNYTDNNESAANNSTYGNFTYRRRKLTQTNDTSTINGVVPTTSTPSGLRSNVPGLGDTNQVGSRDNIGVDDIEIGTW